MNERGDPESWRELWRACTPVMRWRLVILAVTMAAVLAVVAASLVLAVLAWVLYAGARPSPGTENRHDHRVRDLLRGCRRRERGVAR